MNEVTVTKCDDCIHQSVCCHKKDFDDICKAVVNARVHTLESDGKTMSMKKSNRLRYPERDRCYVQTLS